MDRSAPIRLGLVGFGRWGKVLVDSVNGVSETVCFTSVASRDPAKIATEAAQRDMTVAGGLDVLLADDGIDGIVIATPHSLHAEQIKACIAAGKPVLVEKPFTLTVETARTVLQFAQERGVLVAAAHNRRFLAPITALRTLVTNHALGKILNIETQFNSNMLGRYAADSWRLSTAESPSGGLAGSGIHHIDSIIFLDGPIREVFAWKSRRVAGLDMDDTVSAMFRLASGATASLLTITATTPTYRIVIFGTKGRVEIEGSAARRGGEILAFTDLEGRRAEQQYEAFDIERAELEAFAAAIRGVAPYPVTPAEIINGVAAFEAVSRSAESGLPVTLA